jgi:DNA-binding response OmpR family regulator
MRKHCILVVEDQEDLAELYQATLTKGGHDVRIAYTGEEGIAEFQADGADAILLDMTLPEMHGTLALSEIRALDASVPVIVVTGEDNDQMREQCERLGVHDYLVKPFSHDVLLRAVERALKSPSEEVEIVTLRLPSRIIQHLSQLDTNLEKAIIQLCEGK